MLQGILPRLRALRFLRLFRLAFIFGLHLAFVFSTKGLSLQVGVVKPVEPHFLSYFLSGHRFLSNRLDFRPGRIKLAPMKLSKLLTITIISLLVSTAAIVHAGPKTSTTEKPKFLARCDLCLKEQNLTPILVMFNGSFSGMKDGEVGNTAQTTMTFQCKLCKKHTFTTRYEFFIPQQKTIIVNNMVMKLPGKAVPMNAAATNATALLEFAPKPPKYHRPPVDRRFPSSLMAGQ